MITRHHLALVTLCTIILCGALVPFDLTLILVICLGACTGAILPDIQMKKPQRMQIRTLAWLITRFSRIVCTPLMCRWYFYLCDHPFHPEDKRLTHSVPGILCIGSVFAAGLLLPAFLVIGRAALYLPLAFLWGVMLGMVLHLIEDLCTMKGITPVFPFSTIKISGSIRPCDTTDRRIAQFHFCHCSVATIILGFQYFGTLRGIASVSLCMFALVSCLGMMCWSSDVIISSGPAGDGAQAIPDTVMSDPFTVLENPDRSSSGLLMGVYYFNRNER